MKVTEIKIDSTLCNLEETVDCYVSHWSKFICEVMPPKLDNMVVCDFGAGTGIIGIKAALTGAKYVTAIEKNADSRNLLRGNISINGLDSKIDVASSSTEIDKTQFYDYIFCNPACYPTMVGTSSFFHAGDSGMDMIIEAFQFASRALKKNGHLLILIPSVSPSSIAFNMLNDIGLYERPAPTKEIFVPFREHLIERIKSWVDNNKNTYPEVFYHEENGRYYEKVFLYTVHFSDNKNHFKDVEERFFEGFDYRVEMLPYDVIGCIDAANAKMIPLEHELKSLVLKTDKGLYVLSLMGSDFADFRAVKRALNVDEACMASEVELKSLGLKKGAVCPVLKRLWDIPQLVSKEVFDLDYVSTNSGKLNECIMFDPNELKKHQHRELIIGEFSRAKRDV